MSFGLQEPSSEDDRVEWESIVGSIRRAVIYAASKHVLMFVAASNDGKNRRRTFPATMSQVICMHATDGNANDGLVNPPAEDGVFNFATLGVAIKSPRFHAANHAYKSGTSFATPIAASTAAVMLDFARRTTYLKGNAKNGLRTVDGIKKMFELISRRDGTSGEYRYIAPWELWPVNWQVNSGRCSEIMSKIDNAFADLARNVEFPDDTI
jgi:subtilisin family serine protease